MLYKIVNTLKSFFHKLYQNNEYESKKKLIYKIVLDDFYFWEKISLPSYQKNTKYYNEGICPYCNNNIEAKKSRAFKCLHCKNKIVKRTSPIVKNLLYCTESEASEIENIYAEIQKRKKFLEIYKNFESIQSEKTEFVEIGNSCKAKYTTNKIQNLQILLQQIHLGLPKYYKTPEYIDKIRMLRFYEGEIQTFFGSVQQATNAYMTVLYIDLIGNYNELFSNKMCRELGHSVKELKKSGEEEWYGSFIAPGIFTRAFCENLTTEKFEKIFKFNAEIFHKEVSYKLPISVDTAWEKILNYKNNNE